MATFVYCLSNLLTFMLVMYASLSVTVLPLTSCSSVVILKPILLQQQPNSTEPSTTDEDLINVTAPSTHAAVFKHVDDMTFINSSGNDTHFRQRRNAVLNPSALWPRGNIPYIISTRFNAEQRRVILQAMRHWEENTCIRFRRKRSNHTHSIFIEKSRGCASFVGRLPRQYQPQGIDLGFGCVYFNIIVHELGHAIGFYHEHTRPDRNKHINVISNNILTRFKNQFSRIPQGHSNTLGIGYDAASIMHYSRGAFTRNGADTIRARDRAIPIGDAQELSPLDIAKANTLYNCGPSNSWPRLSTVVPREPRLSLPRQARCGRIFRTIMGTFRAPQFPNYAHNLRCAWVIQVPQGYNIRLQFPPSGIETSAFCVKDSVSIYYGNTLARSHLLTYFCDQEHHSYIVYHNVVTVYLHTDMSGGSRRGILGRFTAIDQNECLATDSRCHECINLPGEFECSCRDGYYPSNAARTCYDVNECAFDNGGCQHNCKNTGGSYRCTCRHGYVRQSDGISCEHRNLV